MMTDQTPTNITSRLFTSRYSLLFFIVVACPVIGMRELHVGSDTQNYANYFLRLVSGEHRNRYEVGFQALSVGFSLIIDSYSAYFYILCLITSLCMVASMHIIYNNAAFKDPSLFAMCSIPILLSSSWYITAATNGIRQGVSLPILYIGCILLFIAQKRLVGIAIILTAILFHYTTVFAAAAVVLVYFISTRAAFWVFLVAAAGYPLGVNEHLVMLSSQLVDVDLHGTIASYAAEHPRWHGWQWDLFLYTVFWVPLYIATIPLVLPRLRPRFLTIIKIYMALSLPYFFLGFGSHSNRWAFIAWLFLPILHFSFLITSRFSLSAKVLFSAGLFLIGSLKFLSLMQLVEIPIFGNR